VGRVVRGGEEEAEEAEKVENEGGAVFFFVYE
jgi:hypothetical protein